MPNERYLSRRNLKAISLASLLFVYPVLALSFFSVRYSETIHRVTMTRAFDESIFGSTMADSLAAVGLTLFFVSLSSRMARLKVASLIVFVVSVAAFVAGSEHLLIGGMVTLPFLAAYLIIAVSMRKKVLRSPVSSFIQNDGKKVATVFLAIVIILEVGALMRWTSYPILPTEIYGDSSWRFAELESALFHSFGLLSPVMLMLLAFSFLYKDYIVNLVRKREPPHDTEKKERQASTAPIGDKKRNNFYYSAATHPRFSDNIQRSRNQRFSPIVVQQPREPSYVFGRSKWAILLGGIVASIVITLYPHLPGVNESGAGISTDERSYLKWLDELRIVQTSGLSELFSEVFSINAGDRPLTFLLILVLGDISGLPDGTIVRYLPVLLAPALVLSSYLFVRHGYLATKLGGTSKSNNRFIAAVIAFSAAISPQIAVGLYAGFLANWLALIPAFFAMLFAVRISDEVMRGEGQRERRRIATYSVCLFVALALTMLFHVYTWGYMILVLTLFTCISYFTLRRSKSAGRRELLKVTAVLACVIVASIFTDYAKSHYFGVSSGLSRDSLVAGSSFDLTNFNSRWQTLDFTLSAYVGGFLSNPVIIMLALIWALRRNYLRGFDRLIFSTIFILSIPILFGNSVIQARLLYVVPLFVPAILGLISAREKENRVSLYALVAVMLSLAVYALRAAASLYLVVPGGLELETPFLVS